MNIPDSAEAFNRNSTEDEDVFEGGQFERSAYSDKPYVGARIAPEEEPPEQEPPEQEPPDTKPKKPDWYHRCLTGKPRKNGEKGGVLSCAYNIHLALSEDEKYRGRITRDVVQAQDLLDGEPITDATAAEIQRWVQLAGLRGASLGEVHTQINSIAHANAFDPLKDYLESLTWHGEPRLDNWLKTYLGAKADGADDIERQRQEKYISLVGRYFLIQAVARVYEPGCQADYALILEGAQGELKSSMCRVLGGDWFSDSLPLDVTGKEASQGLRGKWVIEIPELGAFNKSEVTHLKAFITRRTERYRPSYGRCEVHEPRRCVFIATTNDKTYLRDESGGRRFWPVSTGDIRLEAFKADRDQLLAEAVKLYKEKKQYWPSREEEKTYFVKEQESRFQSDAWEEPVLEWLGKRTEPDVTVTEILGGALGFYTNRMQKADQNRITAILVKHGWKRGDREESRRPWRKNS